MAKAVDLALMPALEVKCLMSPDVGCVLSHSDIVGGALELYFLLQMAVASRNARTGTEKANTFYDQQSAATAHVVRMLRVWCYKVCMHLVTQVCSRCLLCCLHSLLMFR